MKNQIKYLLLLVAAVALTFASCKTDVEESKTYYTVTFNTKGGTELASQTVESGKKATRPETDPTKEATATETYTFAGWYTSTDEGKTLSDTAFDFDTAIEGDITLYAKWAVNAVTHTVTFDTKGGSTVTSQTVIYGNKATNPADPTKTATAAETYTFAGWYTSTDGGTTLSDTAFDFDTAIETDITLYAKWTATAITHTVTFNTNGGSTVESQPIIHGNKATRPTDPTKTATAAETYAFDNWYTSTDGGTTLSATAFDFNTEITSDITLYAKWTVNAVTHTVTFNSNGGTDVTSQTIAYGSKATRPTDPTKEETEAGTCVFENWYTSTDEGVTLSETAFDFDTAITDDITLYAKWNLFIETKNCSVINKLFNTICTYNATSFAKSETKPESAEYYLDAAGKYIPLWYDSDTTTLYYYLEPESIMSLRTTDNTNDLFNNMRKLVSIETSDFDTSNVTDMRCMFSRCSALTSLDVSNFDTSKVTTMYAMFNGCNALTSLDVSKFDTSKVTTMYAMFGYCWALKTLDVSNFNTNKVTIMKSMFDNCKALTSLDVSKFDTSNVTDMDGMFSDCRALTSLDVSKFDTSNVTQMDSMFYYCIKLTSLDVSKFDTSNVTNMSKMFYECYSLTTIFASDKFVTNGVTSDSNMFSSSSKLKGGAGTVYDENHIDKEYARIDGGTENPGYFTAKTN